MDVSSSIAEAQIVCVEMQDSSKCTEAATEGLYGRSTSPPASKTIDNDSPIEASLVLNCPPDLFDENDVGPRFLKTPVTADVYTTQLPALLEAVSHFNKALTLHAVGNLQDAQQRYEIVSLTTRNMASHMANVPSKTFAELAMRSLNNSGLIHYQEEREGQAAENFLAAAHFGKNLAPLSEAHRLEYASVLSNWCRVNWMVRDIRDTVLEALKEVLHIRTSILPWDHTDVAAMQYNVALAEYRRQDRKKAILHLVQYLAIASHRAEKGRDDLDPMPALILVLLIRNEDKNDQVSQEVVRGLRTLQDKRQDEGPDGSGVASVLNVVGTLLFHQGDFEHALVFFQEELRLEERDEASGPVFHPDNTTSSSVTCNNIGRILQELGRLKESIFYYERSLKAWQRNASRDCCLLTKKVISEENSAALNLYSTVWYNLGLIYDKLGDHDEAILAFQMSLELRKEIFGPNHPDIACLLYNIGVLQMEKESLDDAAASLEHAIRIRQVGGSGELSDHHFVKTLEKLASLHKAKGNIQGALEASRTILHIQKASAFSKRSKDVGITLRFIAELHQAENDLPSAVTVALDSVNRLRGACLDSSLVCRFANVEQLASSLLLLSSLYHEMCEPLKAQFVINEASVIVGQAKLAAERSRRSGAPSSLVALHEVTTMLARNHCAPKA